ncbi:MAG TPA: hypothetical protein VKM54_14580 [Myxococcota bacterium]|nr:hypothetical protein [Myxococcota bacterium]
MAKFFTTSMYSGPPVRAGTDVDLVVDLLALAVIGVKSADALLGHVDAQIDGRLAARIADDRAPANRPQPIADLDVDDILVARAIAEVRDAFDAQAVSLAVLAIGDEAEDALAILAPDRRGAGVVAFEVGEFDRLGRGGVRRGRDERRSDQCER